MPLLDLAEAAAALLVSAQAILAAEDLDVPARSYVAFATPPMDCEALTVHVASIGDVSLGPQGAGQALSFGQHEIGPFFVIRLVRCYQESDGERPAAIADINASALGLYADAWAMWNGLRNRLHDKSLLDADGPCLPRQLSSAIPIPSQGGYAGWQFILTAALAGDKTLGVEHS